MRILYIDTSSSYLYAGVVEDNKLLCEIKEDLGRELSEKALPLIVNMFNDEDLVPEEIDKIIVVNGPGSFTGIRVGLTIAKVYAWSLNIPITTIYSLEAMALSSDEKVVVPIIDALKGNVYSAIYDNGKEILKPQHIELKNLEEYLENTNNYTYITNENIDLNSKKCSYNPNIERIVNYYADKKPINPHMVNPEYLKLSSAEEKKQNDRETN